MIEVEDDDESDITPPPTMSESTMFLQHVRDLALSMKDQTLLESIIRSQELLLRAIKCLCNHVHMSIKIYTTV